MVPHKLGVAGKLFLLEFKVNENVTKCHLTAGMMMPVKIDVLTLLPSMVFTTFYILIKKTSPSLLSSLSPPHLPTAVILKVVATLLKNSSPSAELMEVRRLFLSDMIKLFSNSRENRR